MLARLVMELEGEIDKRSAFQKASLFHGFLHDVLPPDYAALLHEEGLRPFSQYLSSYQDHLYWTIQVLDQASYEMLLLPFLEDSFQEVWLKHNDLKLAIISKQLNTYGYKSLLEDYYFGACSRFTGIQFTSPTAFKQNGTYVFIPDLRLIYQSLMLRYDSFSEGNTVYLEETLEELAQYTEITGYNLRSYRYPLEGVKIPSFWGSIQLKIGGPRPLVNLATMLLRYGEYSGVGIKTAIGMGGMQVIERGKKYHD